MKKYYYANGARVAMDDGGTIKFLFGDHLGSKSIVTGLNGVKLTPESHYKPSGEAWRHHKPIIQISVLPHKLLKLPNDYKPATNSFNLTLPELLFYNCPIAHAAANEDKNPSSLISNRSI